MAFFRHNSPTAAGMLQNTSEKELIMAQTTYTADQVKKMLAESMNEFSKGMIALIKDCAKSPNYQKMTSAEALNLIADKLEKLRQQNA